MKKLNCFPPIVRADARVLILGSLPGEESLRRGEYYAKPQNAFWKIMGRLLGFEYPGTDYFARTRILVEHRIALWDVCAAANRVGSLDSAIEQVEINDFADFFERYHQIELVCFNGGKAESLFTRHHSVSVIGPRSNSPTLQDQRKYQRLPSTSPAYAAMRFEEKNLIWASIISPFISPFLGPT